MTMIIVMLIVKGNSSPFYMLESWCQNSVGVRILSMELMSHKHSIPNYRCEMASHECKIPYVVMYFL